jgi:sulfur carrier protein ThiS
MRFITLFRVPGNGATDVEVSDTWTLQDLATRQNLNDRSLYIAGEIVPRSQWATRTLAGVVEVVATAEVKGA